jgi:hypothetical protein
MQELLQEILSVQKEILGELRRMRAQLADQAAAPRPGHPGYGDAGAAQAAQAAKPGQGTPAGQARTVRDVQGPAQGLMDSIMEINRSRRGK